MYLTSNGENNTLFLQANVLPGKELTYATTVSAVVNCAYVG
jgi:hypothetical protein